MLQSIETACHPQHSQFQNKAVLLQAADILLMFHPQTAKHVVTID
jgi:hypothetical protein